jgi:hypothetical protein
MALPDPVTSGLSTSATTPGGSSLSISVLPKRELTRPDLAQPAGPGALINIPTPLTQLRFPLDTPMYYMTIGIHTYSRFSWSTVGTLDILASINLCVPENLMDNHHVEYDPEPLGTLVGMGWELGRQATTSDSLKSFLSGLDPAALGKLGLAKLVPQIAGELGQAATNAVLAQAGLALNNFLTVMLKGPAYKRRQFKWHFSPKTAQESEQLRLIIDKLNNAMAPSLPTNVGSAFFGWPNIFTAEFRYQNIPGFTDVAKYTFRMKPMVLVNAAFNYAPAGQFAYYGQTKAPESVEIMLEFLEIEYWLKDQFGQPSGTFGTPNFVD